MAAFVIDRVPLVESRAYLVDRSPWWLRPSYLVIGFLIPITLLFAFAVPHTLSTVPDLTNRYSFVSLSELASALGLLLTFALGSQMSERRTSKRRRHIGSDWRRPVRALRLLFILTMLAYALWFGPLLAREPTILVEVALGEPGAMYRVREAASTIPGVTTMTQFGVSYSLIYAALRWRLRYSIPRSADVMMLIILVLAILRSVLWSERIAVLEILIPMTAVYLSKRSNQHWLTSIASKAFPFALVLGAPLIFALYEYPRSWLNHYVIYYDNYSEFVLDRVLLYYTTSLNNAAGIVEVQGSPTYTGSFTFRWLFEMPGVKSLADAVGWKLPNGENSLFLSENTLAEFTNFNGILTIVHDWGLVGGLLFALAGGWLCGVAYKAFRSGTGSLSYLFPLIFYGLVELPRVGYLYEGRMVAAVIGVLIAARLAGRRH